jgi:predicted nucleic acid-binding protein
MLFDTDVLIWALRGNAAAQKAIDGADERSLSVVTLMELLQGARNHEEQRLIKQFLNELGFETLPIFDSVSHRAAFFIEAYALTAGLRLVVALIFATACANSLTLCSGNRKHAKSIPALPIRRFAP